MQGVSGAVEAKAVGEGAEEGVVVAKVDEVGAGTSMSSKGDAEGREEAVTVEAVTVQPVAVSQDAGAVAEEGSGGAGIQGSKVGYVRQFIVLQRKCWLILLRKLLAMVTLLLAPLCGVLITWGFDSAYAPKDARHDYSKNVSAFPEIDSCGVATNAWIAKNNADLYYLNPSMNNGCWDNGICSLGLSFGPVVVAIVSFAILQSEALSKMIAVLRGMGVRESVYWLSWYWCFFWVALPSSLLAAGVAKALPVHVFQQSPFGPIFLSLWFLQLGLVAASFFVAALVGSAPRVTVWIGIQLVAAWAAFVLSLGGLQSYTVPDTFTGYGNLDSGGLAWFYTSTAVKSTSGLAASSCQKPIVASSYTKLMSSAEAAMMPQSDFFQGCYVASSKYAEWWEAKSTSFALFIFVLTPYYHFGSIWSQLVGATYFPGQRFSMNMMGMPPSQLASETLQSYVLSLSSPVPVETAFNGTLFPQNSLATTSTIYFNDNGGPGDTRTNCPIVENGCSSYLACPPLNRGPVSAGAPSVNDSLGYLVLLVVINLLLAIYWAQVFPCGNGVPQPFYFPFMPSYWTGKQKDKPSAGASGEVHAGDLQIRNVCKSYGGFQAVNGVSLSACRGELVALLGHNGAGKSTLSKIITCDIAPTAGSVGVFGREVNGEVMAVRRLIGVCHQDDYLYETLTARENLELYAGLRGVPPDEIPALVSEWLEDVELLSEQHHRAGTFSGGMKRRLSVALATIGDVPLIILDEPTTGMDPQNRRSVWGHIEKIKKDRIVLLTTHAMEEADLLADRVAIMAQGQIVANDAPLALKSQYGSALQFSLLMKDSDPAAVLEAGHVATIPGQAPAQQENIPEALSITVDGHTKSEAIERVLAEVRQLFAGHEAFVQIDHSNAGTATVKILKLDVSGDSGLKGEGVPAQVLSAFVKWLQDDQADIQEWGFSNASLEEVYLAITKHMEARENPQVRLDELTTDVCCPCCATSCIRCCLQGCCRCCCCPKPLQSLDAAGAKGDEDLGNPAVHIEDARQGLNQVASFVPRISFLNQLRVLFLNEFKQDWTGATSVANWVVYSLFLALGVGLFVGITWENFDPFMPIILVVIASIIWPSLQARSYSDRTNGMFHFLRTQGMLGTAFVTSRVLYIAVIQFVFVFLLLTLSLISPTFRGPDYRNECFNVGANGLLVRKSSYDPVTGAYTPVPSYCYQGALSASGTFYQFPWPGNYGQLFGIMVMFALAAPGILTMFAYLPGNKRAIAFLSLIALGLGVAPIALGFVPSVIDLGTCLSAGSVGPFCAKNGFAMIPQFGMYMALTAYQQSRFAVVPHQDGQKPWTELGVSCTSSGVCDRKAMQERFGEILGWMFFGAVVFALGGFLATILFEFRPKFVQQACTPLKNAWVSVRHPRQTRRAKKNAGMDAGNKDAEADQVADMVAGERAKVVGRLQHLASTPELSAPSQVSLPSDSDARALLPLVALFDLNKIYPGLGGQPPKHAVDNLSLCVEKGQVLGLLGKNGAGKTTALKILSGTHSSTDGLALVAGYDVNTEALRVFERLGNCPQFDIVWPKVTVQQHLEFFFGLKGMPKAQVREAARQLAEAVGLGEVGFDRHAGKLSGGMRRRLSLAMSLIGAPHVLLLDEPTTGLDPSTRNNIWNLVHSFANPERAIVITTHMMLEADALSNRIAIMKKGKLKVIGSAQTLKDRFGEGYTLQLNLMHDNDADRDQALAFVKQQVHPDAYIIGKQGKTFKLKLPKEGLELTRVFSAMYSPASKEQGRINQFLLSQATLEDIFIAVA